MLSANFNYPKNTSNDLKDFMIISAKYSDVANEERGRWIKYRDELNDMQIWQDIAFSKQNTHVYEICLH